ncbi:MAG: hypothetical protein ACP5N3_06675 [Candidatus Nanoarchaeia archaeon]
MKSRESSMMMSAVICFFVNKIEYRINYFRDEYNQHLPVLQPQLSNS